MNFITEMIDEELQTRAELRDEARQREVYTQRFAKALKPHLIPLLELRKHKWVVRDSDILVDWEGNRTVLLIRLAHPYAGTQQFSVELHEDIVRTTPRAQKKTTVDTPDDHEANALTVLENSKSIFRTLVKRFA